LLHELLEGRGFFMLRGFPVADYTREEQAIAYMGIGSYFGRPRSQNAKGHLLGHVKDLGLDIADPRVRYYQTNRRLEYHTDSIDVVGLLCLKTARAGGESFIVSSCTIYNEILARRPDLVPALFEPFATDRRGEVPEGMKPWFDIPVYHWHAGRLTGIYVRQYIESAQRNFPAARRLTEAQFEAMDLMDEIANDPAVHLAMAFAPATCSSCTTTRSCMRATTSRTGRSQSVIATCCGCGSRRWRGCRMRRATGHRPGSAGIVARTARVAGGGRGPWPRSAPSTT
jgi:RNase P subunit RPR2